MNLRALAHAHVLVLVAFALFNITTAAAQTESVLYSFTGGLDGSIPGGGLIFDSSGNLYGTTVYGGDYGNGTVFELSPSLGGWIETVLYSFAGGTDGRAPFTGRLVFDGAGNLYGTTADGGAFDAGVVFELSPASGTWTETILHTFTGGRDGGNPSSGVVFDSAGNLFGTTTNGGRYKAGVVYKLTRKNSSWSETVIHTFAGKTDGKNPFPALIFDGLGNLYGTTFYGGISSEGTVFQLTQASGQWTENILYSFKRAGDGANPYAGLVFDSSGNLYGTAQRNGGHASGAVFQLSPNLSGWTETILYSFKGGVDGQYPYAELIFDQLGNAYSVTISGGTFGAGTVFELTPAISGQWSETVLHSFTGGVDGGSPSSGLISDSAGNLYGTAEAGGQYNKGIIFEITP